MRGIETRFGQRRAIGRQTLLRNLQRLHIHQERQAAPRQVQRAIFG